MVATSKSTILFFWESFMGDDDLGVDFDEPTAIRSTRKTRGKKAVSLPESKEQESSEAEQPQVDNGPTVAPSEHVDPVTLHGQASDEHGNEVGDVVVYWMGSEYQDILIPHTAILLELKSDGAWSGCRFRPVAQGYYAVQVLRHSDVPRHGYFTKKKRK